jgi:hypothetical protein
MTLRLSDFTGHDIIFALCGRSARMLGRKGYLD